MERAAWTDERLDDLARHLDARFDLIDRGFEQVGRRFDRLEDELRGMGSALRTEMNELRNVFVRIGGGVILGLVGVIAAVISTG